MINFCGNCKFWSGDSGGQCRRYPPNRIVWRRYDAYVGSATHTQPHYDSVSLYPDVARDHPSCGEYDENTR